MLENSQLGRQFGWKIGATNQQAQKNLGFGPFYGPLFQSCLLQEGSAVSKKSLGTIFTAAEAEIALILGEDLPVRTSGRQYTVEEVWSRVRSVVPSVELCATRLSIPLTPSLIVADFALNAAVVLGKREYNPNAVPRLSGIKTSLLVNDNVITSEFTSNVLGGPAIALTWLANELNKNGKALFAGDLVMTGAVVAVRSIEENSKVTARFDDITGHTDREGSSDYVTVHLSP